MHGDRPAQGPAGNAVMQCGRIVGYVVSDEEGKPLLVDEDGRPVKAEHAHRKPVPPHVDDEGNPHWAHPS